MPRKMNLVLVLVLFAMLCAFGAAVLLFPSEHLSQADLQPRSPVEASFRGVDFMRVAQAAVRVDVVRR